MIRVIPWLLCLILAAGWYFSAHPEQSPFRSILQRAGVAATVRERMVAEWSAIGFDSSAIGRQWLQLGDSVLTAPQPTQLPLSLRAYFGQEPAATAWSFRAQAGQRLPITLEANLLDGHAIVELYILETSGDSTRLKYLRDIAVGSDTLDLATDRNHDLVLRVEATPLAQGNVRVRIGTAPLLSVFPVQGAGLREIQSRWGVDRDGGKRRHEGIDIFRPRGTPLLAAAAGRIVQVKEGGLGGRQVWLRPQGASVSLYYAHLDQWSVEKGQLVSAGDTIGTVGNTGNARTTPSHLHFGVYSRSGAIDPLPFVAPAVAAARPLGAEIGRSGATRLNRSVGSGDLRLSAKLFARPLATANAQAWVQLADGSEVLVAVDALENATPARADRQTISEPTLLRARLSPTAPALDSLSAGTEVRILAFGAGRRPSPLYIESPSGKRGWLLR